MVMTKSIEPLPAGLLNGQDRAYIYYHADCLDGFCAAWVFSRTFPTSELIPARYGTEVPDNACGDVFIVDFSWPRDQLIKLRERCRTLVVLDHHKSAAEALAGLEFCEFDMNRSGARMTLDWVKARGLCDPLVVQGEWLIDYVEDHDLWRHKLPKSLEVNSALKSYDLDMVEWDTLANKSPSELADEGTSILRYRNQVVNHHLKHLEQVRIGDLVGHGCQCSTPDIWSILGAAILAHGEVDLALVWVTDIDGKRMYTLRSSVSGPDVSKIAVQFGGGGHARAAGFSLPWEQHGRVVHERLVKPVNEPQS